MCEHTFNDIETVVEDVHKLFEGWLRTNTAKGSDEEYAWLLLKLAVHEWIGNLVQHAAFKATPPCIRLRVSTAESGLRCMVEDNSEGFDLEAQVVLQAKLLKSPEPSERGRGLLMLLACTEEFVYESLEDGHQYVEFVVRPPVDTDAVPAFFPASENSIGLA